MKKIGIKFLQTLSYEQFESFQYLLEYDFEYENMEEAIKEQKVIPLDMDEEEDYADDIEVLNALLVEFDGESIGYELYVWDGEWKSSSLGEICKNL
jgi:hypothetical protein